MRQMLSSNSELQRKIELLEGKYDEQFATVFQAIKQLMVKEREPRKAIGYRSS
jgi:DnaJ-domain-containing protein 1